MSVSIKARIAVRALLATGLFSSLLCAATGAALAADALPKPAAVPWSDSFTTRLAALALLQTLNADLLSHDSATLTLERWCAAHQLASPATVVADRVRDVDKQPGAEERALLGVDAVQPVKYRRVRLRCGDRVLSEADNWYVPARLTPAMDQALDSSDIPFGKAVQALNYRRRTLSAQLLWSPLPEGWERTTPSPTQGAATLDVPPQVLQHKAVLTLPDGTPFSHVVETYTSEVLRFPEPARSAP
jgi:chorismate-pyruvate lyase